MKKTLSILSFLLLASIAFAQPKGFDIYNIQTNPYTNFLNFITLDTLQEAKTLKDIHSFYRSAWVDEYIKVEVSTTCMGFIKSAFSSNDTLTQEQLNLLRSAGNGCSIDYAVDYIPNNNLKDNPPRKMGFSLLMIPIYEAKYPGGRQALDAYLQAQIMDKISEEAFNQIKMANVRFHIDEEGKVSNAYLFKGTENQALDQLMLEAISNMPRWLPAQNAQRKNIKQEFEFGMGTLLKAGC